MDRNAIRTHSVPTMHVQMYIEKHKCMMFHQACTQHVCTDTGAESSPMIRVEHERVVSASEFVPRSTFSGSATLTPPSPCILTNTIERGDTTNYNHLHEMEQLLGDCEWPFQAKRDGLRQDLLHNGKPRTPVHGALEIAILDEDNKIRRRDDQATLA